MGMGRVEAIWKKRAHRGPMDAAREALFVEGEGVEGSVGRSRRRQVTIIEKERWDGFMRALGGSIDPSSRRANLMVSGIELAHARGRILRVGGARIAVGGETTPCERMEEALPGLQDAMRVEWGGGVFGQVITTGLVSVGDPVEWEVPARE
jgi:MOSC domain-containing protein YiiM